MKLNGARIHLIGIGGAGMSSLARYLHGRGAHVTGSDAHASPSLERLAAEGIGVTAGQDARNLDGKVDLVVRTAAVTESNPEFRACMERGTAHLKYSEMLGLIMKRHTGIAVAGTHGKTTVSAMAAFLLDRCGLEPSYVIGGEVAGLGDAGGAFGRGEHLVVEACEYDRSFLHLAPTTAVVTNIEADHLDYYRDIADVRSAFADFASRIETGAFKNGRPARDGALIIWDGVAAISEIVGGAGGVGRAGGAGGTDANVLTFGFSNESDLAASQVRCDAGGSTFELLFRGDSCGSFRINQPGRHNVLNAVAATAAALEAGCGLDGVRDALPLFNGVGRRMERRGEFGSVILYSDYAHHPTEISAVHESMRLAHADRRLVSVYQAHQRSRTAHFLDGLATTLSGFDLTLVTETFSVRESGVESLPGGRELADEIALRGGRGRFIGDLDDAVDGICETVDDNDVVILMGAGDIDEIAGPLAKKLRQA